MRSRSTVQCAWLRLSACAVVWGALIAGGLRLDAQEEQSSTREATARASGSDPAVPLRGIPAQVTYLPGPDGVLVPVPAEATLEDYLEYLRTRGPGKEDAGMSPAYSITSLLLEGTADEERAIITARLHVQIHREQETVSVPIRLDEGVLRETQYTGNGEAGFLNRDAGYTWWFRGKGDHVLQLTLSVSVRKQLPTRRLQLSLPVTAVSSLKLRVPLQQISVKTTDQSAARTQPAGDAATEIEVFGLGPRLDVTWQPLPSPGQVETVLEAATYLMGRLSPESVVLDGIQRIRASQGSFQEFTLTLPAGFELVNVEGREYLDHDPVPNELGRVIVKLAQPTTGPIDLLWTARADAPADGLIRLAGFELDGRARRQSGEIALSPAEGFRILSEDMNDPAVHRINISELRPELRQLSGAGQITRAYRFLRQPFQLAVALREVEPHFTVEPHFYLLLSADGAEFEGDLRFQIFRGSIQDVSIPWPKWREEGWVVESVEPLGLVDGVETQSGPEGDAIQVRLVERQDKSFRLRIKARLEFEEPRTSLNVSFPTVVASSVLPSAVVVAGVENVELQFTPTGQTSPRPLPSAFRDELNLPESMAGLDVIELRVTEELPTFVAEMKVQPQRLRAESVTRAVLESDRLMVTQRVLYDVRYQRLPQARLLVPIELAERVRFTLGDGTELLPAWTALEEGTVREARLDFPEPQIGRFEVQAHYAVQVGERFFAGDEVTVPVPLLHSSDSQFTESRFVLEDSEHLRAVTADADWKYLLKPDGGAEWSGPGTEAEFPLVLSLSADSGPKHDAVSKALVRTVFDRNGLTHTRAQYRVRGAGSVFAVSLPADSISPAFWWNRERLRGESILELPAGSRNYALKLPGAEVDSETLLTITYQVNRNAAFGWSDSNSVAAPRFPESVWVAQTLWQVFLPIDQHLLTYPSGVTPQFHWERSRVFWSRVADPDLPSPEDWIAAEDGPSEGTIVAASNVYSFSQYGPVSRMRFRSMSRPMVVLMGAGLALAASFLLLNVPATRHVLTALVAAFAVALAGLWFRGPMELLLQPAVLGLALACVAVLIEGWVSRRRRSLVLTLNSASEFPGKASSINRPLAPVVGSDDPTLHRPLHVEAPGLVSSESGSHR